MSEVVYALFRQSRCFGCDTMQEKGAIVKMQKAASDASEIYCQKCSKLENFVALPSGDAQLTRLSKKYSGTVFEVKRWSELWKCYERVGLLVEKEALEKARLDIADKDKKP